MNHALQQRLPSWSRTLSRGTLVRWLAAGVAAWGFAATGIRAAAQTPTLSEYQVKALYLVNFAKYVDWPADAFRTETAPVVIGIVGRDDLGANLEQATEGKSINGRKLLVQHVAGPREYKQCHILFISSSEKDRLGKILDEIKETPVLTVGETDDFLALDGIINCTKKSNKIRLEINVAAAQRARLKISSKLLSVADKVIGKTEARN